MPDLVPVEHDPFSMQFVSIDHDPFTTDQDEALSRSMTHYSPDPTSEEVGRRVRQAGQNLYNTWLGPAERLGRAATSGTLDVTDPNTAGDAMALTLGAAGVRMPFARAGELGSAGGKGITAYHGSPHDFDRFDLSKIGTGEGAQAYGHGLYFAENEKVAADYKNKLSNLRLKMADDLMQELAKSPVYKGSGLLGHATDLMSGKTSIESVPENIRNSVRQILAGPRETPGKTYQVAIKADPEHFLDWDKPLSEQHQKVQEAIGKLDLAQRSETDPWDIGRKNYFARKGQEVPEDKGENIIDRMRRRSGGNDVPVTDVLRQAGIPGIKYLDQGSRAGGEGTRNYVVFDDKLIDILKKYGIAGIGALPAMGAYHFRTQQVDHDPFTTQ